MATRFKAILGIVGLWLVTNVADWALARYLDTIASETGLQAILAGLSSFLSYITGGFGLGFILGALLFSVWDWPVLGKWIRQYRERQRNKEADDHLATECEAISKYLYEQAATLERLRNDQFWAGAQRENSEQAWREARASEAREEERIRRQIGQQVQSLIVKLKERGVKMDLWGLSLSHHDLPTASYFFAELASALQSGTYLEKEFKAGRAGLPPRL